MFIAFFTMLAIKTTNWNIFDSQNNTQSNCLLLNLRRDFFVEDIASQTIVGFKLWKNTLLLTEPIASNVNICRYMGSVLYKYFQHQATMRENLCIWRLRTTYLYRRAIWISVGISTCVYPSTHVKQLVSFLLCEDIKRNLFNWKWSCIGNDVSLGRWRQRHN